MVIYFYAYGSHKKPLRKKSAASAHLAQRGYPLQEHATRGMSSLASASLPSSVAARPLRGAGCASRRVILGGSRAASAAASKAKGAPGVEAATEGKYEEAALAALDNCVTSSNLAWGERYEGKVRDTYVAGDYMIAVTTDRQSAFDRHLASIPFKGAVLNQTSAWWFEETKDIVPNAWLASPDPNVTVMKRCEVFPIEFVVRGYMTGSTSTSLWTHYKNGGRDYCGNKLAEGMVKNQKLPANIVTPTTKEKEHDRPISLADIVSEGWMAQDDLDYCVAKTLEVFAHAQKVAAKRGLILVDTKYEFGKDADGVIRLIDEINTPDSSRYWLMDSYEERHAKGEEPKMIDKEFLRLWFADRCDPYNDKVLPVAPPELVVELSQRYIKLYEMITRETFVVPPAGVDVDDRINANVSRAMAEMGVAGGEATDGAMPSEANATMNPDGTVTFKF